MILYWLLSPLMSRPLGGDTSSLFYPTPLIIRCRLGDVVQVVGAYNQCPVVKFTCR